MAANGKITLLRNYAARRAAQANALDAVVAAIGKTSDPEARKGLLDGILDGTDGRRKVPAPDGWPVLYAKLKEDSHQGVSQAALRLAQRFGDSKATTTMLATVSNAGADIEQRREAIRGLAAQRHEKLAPNLVGLLDDGQLRIDAIRAIAAYDNEGMANELLGRYNGFSSEEKRATIQTLAARPKSGWKLALAIKDKKIPRSDIPAYVARQLRRVAGSGFVEIWGPIDELSGDKAKAFEKYRKLLTDEAIAKADPSHGRAIYTKVCATCHKMYGEGGDLGPDITGSNRADLNYILDNILDPSSEIPEGYQMVVITTRDGRTYSGNVANETEREVVLRLVGADPVTIEKSAIQSRESPKVSLMPPGLLDTMKEDEVKALIAYLKTTKQVPAKN